MDIAKPDNSRARRLKRVIYAAILLLFVGGTTIAVSRLRPAGPAVDRSTIWTGEVTRGAMLRDVHGIGTLVPEDIRWIPAQTDSRVDRIVLKPGAQVKAESVLIELSNPSLQRDTLDAEYQLKAAIADYENLKVAGVDRRRDGYSVRHDQLGFVRTHPVALECRRDLDELG